MRQRLLFGLLAVLVATGCNCGDKPKPVVDCNTTGTCNDGGSDAGPTDAGSDAGPTDAGSDAGPTDAGPTDGGPDGGTLTIRFPDLNGVDPALSDGGLSIDDRDGGALAIVAFPTGDCSGGDVTVAGDSTKTLDAGVYYFNSLTVQQAASLSADGPLDLRVCGSVILDSSAQITSTGPLRITAWGNVELHAGSEISSDRSLFLAAPDAGSTVSIGGASVDVHGGNPPDADGGAGLAVFVNGDLDLVVDVDSDGSLYSEPPVAGQSDPLVVVAAGNLRIENSGQIYTDTPPDGPVSTLGGGARFGGGGAQLGGPGGGTPNPAASAAIKLAVGGDLLLKGNADITTNESSSFREGPIRIDVRGKLTEQGFDQNNVPRIETDGPSGLLTVRAGGDLELIPGLIDSLTDDIYNGDSHAVLDLATQGTFRCSGRYIGSGAAGDPSIDGNPSSTLEHPTAGKEILVRARAIEAGDGCLIRGGGAGPGADAGNAGSVTLTAGDGGINATGSSLIVGAGTSCAPGVLVTLKSEANIFLGDVVAADDTSAPENVRGGDSFLRNNPDNETVQCFAGRGGDAVAIAAQAVDAGPVQFDGGGHPWMHGGSGNPQGNVVVSPNTSVAANIPAPELTQRSQAVGNAYDFGQPVVLSAARLKIRGQGSLPVELAVADAAAGPFATWVSSTDAAGLAALGAHRYLRWRASLDWTLFVGAELEEIAVDWHRP